MILPGSHLEVTGPCAPSLKIKMDLNSVCVFKQSLKNVAEDESIRHGHIIFLLFFIIIIHEYSVNMFFCHLK